VRQGSIDQVSKHRFDDRVLTMGNVGPLGGEVGVGEERVIPPDREQSASKIQAPVSGRIEA